ncbi:MAG TPA: hypothetical protein ENJ34_00240 [Epsilonproteobacteria bacterium]|nr:hypothetical protein [Campylobacterota bacterium]
MKKQMIHFLLLFSLFFNIAHASIIATEDSCQHESAHEYITEQAHATDCGDLCDIHHLFHFMAIIIDTDIHFTIPPTRENVKIKLTLYTPPFQETSIKPPIA